MAGKFEIEKNEAEFFGKFIQKKRIEKGLGLNQFAQMTGINPSDLSRVEKGQKLKLNPFYLKEIAFGLNIDYLKLFEMIGYIDKKTTGKESDIEILDNIVKIPIYDRVSAGAGAISYGEEVDSIYLNEFMGNDNIIGINVMGDSMEPIIEDGSILLVDTSKSVKNGDVGVFTYCNENYVKVLNKTDNRFFLSSYNPSYLPIFIEENEFFNTVGKVVEVIIRRKL